MCDDVDWSRLELSPYQMHESAFALALSEFANVAGRSICAVDYQAFNFDDVFQRPLEIPGVPDPQPCRNLDTCLDCTEHVATRDEGDGRVVEAERDAVRNRSEVGTVRQVGVVLINEKPPSPFARNDLLVPLAGIKIRHVIVMNMRLHSNRTGVDEAVAHDLRPQPDRPALTDINGCLHGDRAPRASH